MRSILLIALIATQPFIVAAQKLTPHNITSAGHPNIGFYDFKPSDFTTDPSKKFPLIIALSGKGEKGDGTTQLDLVFTSGIGYLVKHGATLRFNYPNNVKGSFVALFPQLDGQYSEWQSFYIDEMITWARANLNIDTNRVFITGYSLGGGGTWVYPASSLAAAKRVTGLLPISGSKLPSGDPCNIAKGGVAVWAIHTSDDDQIATSYTSDIVNAINACGPTEPIVGWYPKGNHQIYDGQIYPDTANKFSYPTIYQWMLRANRKNTPQNNLPPVADVGATDTTVVVNSNMMFFQKKITGELSQDPNDVIVRYKWQITSNNLSKVFPFNGYQPADTSTAWPAVYLDYKNWSWPWQNLEFHGVGDYVFKLTVTDMFGAISTQTKTIHITNNGVNTAPVVNLGNDVTLASGATTASFMGTKVFDWEGQTMSYKVTQESGPKTAQLSITNWYQFSVSDLTLSGTYTFKLAVTDAGGAVGVDYVTVTKPADAGTNNPPVPKITGTTNIMLPINSITLDGSTSTDSDGSIAAYLWTQTAGPNTSSIVSPTGKSTVINNLIAGTYIFQLKVTDDKNATATTSISVTVNPAANVPPVARITGTTNITLPINSITLDGSTSTDSDGSIAAYGWIQTAGPNTSSIVSPTGKSTVINNLIAGTYIFQLKVTDDKNATATTSISVTVNPAANVPPVARITGTTNITLPINSITLDGSTSTDSDGSIAAYGWIQTAGPNTSSIVSPTGKSTVINNLIAGTYTFQLKITDNKNATGATSITVNVNSASTTNKPPVANASGDFSTTNSYAYLSAGSSYDPDGKITVYNWLQVSGPSTATILSGNTVFPTVQNLKAGVYVFRVWVTDNAGASASDDVQVTVGGNKSPIASAGNDFTTNNSTAYLSAAASLDVDGSITAYAWVQVSGPNAATILSGNTVFPTVQNLVTGVYVFRVTVTDNLGAKASDDVQVTVSANRLPVANAGSDFSTIKNYAYLSAGASYDPDGKISAFSWLQVSGPNTSTILSGNTMFPTIQGLITGTYTFRLKVTDNEGASATDDIVINVTTSVAAVAVTQTKQTIKEISAETMSLYPNPASDQLTISFSNNYVGNYKVIVYDVTGKVEAQYNFTKSSAGDTRQRLDISGLPVGLHFIEVIYNGNQHSAVQKFIRQ